MNKQEIKVAMNDLCNIENVLLREIYSTITKENWDKVSELAIKIKDIQSRQTNLTYYYVEMKG